MSTNFRTSQTNFGKGKRVSRGGGGYEKILIVVFLKSHSVTQSVSLSVSLSVELINDISF